MELVFPGLELARRLEASDAENARAAATEVLEIGGGFAAFAGPESPLTHAIGVGMHGPVTESDIDRIEDFYRFRGAACNIDLCPLADPTLFDRLGRRAYRVTEFNNVLVMRVAALEVATPRVRIVDDVELWARTLTSGFLEKDELEEHEIDAGRSLMAMPETGAFLAEVDGVAAAGAAARVQGPLATLFADSTRVAYRNRGLQKELIAARLAWAEQRGCTLATASTLPGTPSQWNYMRAGFQVAYTKLNMCRDF